MSGDDFDRRLAPRGVTESAQMARTLAELGFMPDVALVSPAARTRDTWAAAEAAFPRAKVLFDGDLYNSDSGGVRQAAEAAGRTAGTVLVIGHNPGLQELTVRLADRGPRAVDADPPRAAQIPDGGGLGLPVRRRGTAELRRPLLSGAGPLSRIYKILPRADWTAAHDAGRFEGSALDRQDGFIHFSTGDQARETARRHFAGQADLVVLEVGVRLDDLGEALRAGKTSRRRRALPASSMGRWTSATSAM